MSSELSPPPAITKELFAKWRSPRRGSTQAERMDNPVWQWMLEDEVGTFTATDHFQLGTAHDLGPGWCGERFGQSETRLPDGRVILIAGEHEDHYDPDFFIYNDVIVKNPDGSVHFYCYPEDDFLPTDFHSATLLEEGILLIGNLGYPESRRAGETLVQILDLKNFHVRQIKTQGDGPGWIGDHEAKYLPVEKKIIITGGEVFGADGSLLENIDDWQLDLFSWTWKRLTERKWTRVEFAREDGGWIDLFEMRSAGDRAMAEEGLRKMKEEMKELFEEEGIEDSEMLEELISGSRFEPSKEPETLAALYHPPVELEEVSGKDFDVFRLKVDGVMVRYNEKGDHIVMTIEGELSSELVEVLTGDLKEKLGKVLDCEIKTRAYR